MAEDNQNSGTGSGDSAVADDTAIVADKSKSAEQYILEAEAMYIVPKLVRGKFPDLIKLIYETESMDAEEREYWLQIMPIMTEDQIVKFREILVNEKQQLDKLDEEYDQEMQRINQGEPAAELDEAKIKEEIQRIKKAETASQASEKAEEEALLDQLKDL